MFGGLLQPTHLVIIAGLGFMVFLPFWQIFKKAGFSPWLSLLMAIPLVSLCALYYLAFARWPANPK
jgi:hypothetical protein